MSDSRRLTQLRATLHKALETAYTSKSCGPASVETCFPDDLRLSHGELIDGAAHQVYKNMRKHIEDEFEQIVIEKKLNAGLTRLEELNRSNEVLEDGSRPKFSPRRAAATAQSVSLASLRREKTRLQQALADRRQENARLQAELEPKRLQIAQVKAQLQASVEFVGKLHSASGAWKDSA